MLRTSGDVSISEHVEGYGIEYAPHERRCFYSLGRLFHLHEICSARAEMFLLQLLLLLFLLNMLRTSGDVSCKNFLNILTKPYAPHERRCFWS